MNTLGFFSEPSYITIGDPYASTEGNTARLRSVRCSGRWHCVGSPPLNCAAAARRQGGRGQDRAAVPVLRQAVRRRPAEEGPGPPARFAARPALACRSSAETPAAWAQVAKDVYFDDFKRLYEVRARSPQTAAAPPRLGLTVRALRRARSTSTPGRSRRSRRWPTTQARSAATGSRTARPRRSAPPPRDARTPPSPGWRAPA